MPDKVDRYVKGQRVTVAPGRHGYLTGKATLEGNPFVRFGPGPSAEVVLRPAIADPLAHLLDSDGELAAALRSPAVAEGDVLVALSSGSRWIRTGSGLAPVSAVPDRGLYEKSHHLARNLAVSSTGLTAVGDLVSSWLRKPAVQPPARAETAQGRPRSGRRQRYRLSSGSSQTPARKTG